MGWMADFPPLLASSVFDFSKHYVPQIQSQTMRHPLVNLLKHNFISKICGPIIEIEHLWVCTKFMCLHEYIFLYPWSTGMKQVFFYQIISECNSQFWFNVMSWVSRIRDILVVNYRCKNITTIKKINKISVLQLLKLISLRQDSHFTFVKFFH